MFLPQFLETCNQVKIKVSNDINEVLRNKNHECQQRLMDNERDALQDNAWSNLLHYPRMDSFGSNVDTTHRLVCFFSMICSNSWLLGWCALETLRNKSRNAWIVR